MNNISNILSLTGQENNKYLAANIYFPQFHGMSPYHYFELWYNALLSFLPYTSIVTLMLFVYPTFYFITLLGIISLWELFSNVKFSIILISYLLLFLGLLSFDFYDNFDLLKDHGLAGMQIFFIGSKKLSVIYPFVILSFILFIQDRKIEFAIVLISLCICNVGVFPGILGGLFFFLLTNNFHKALTGSEIKKIFFIIALFSISFAGLYLLFGTKNSDSLGFGTIFNNILQSFDPNYYKKIFFRITIPVIKIAIMFLPFLLFYLWVLFKNRRDEGFKEILKLNYLVILILLIGLFAGSIAIFIFSGEQFFYDLLPLAYIFVIFIFIYEYKRLEIKNVFKPVYKGIIFLIVILFLIQNSVNNFKLHNSFRKISDNLYSEEYLQKVTQILEQDKNLNHLGCCFFSQENITCYPLDQYGLYGTTFSGIPLKFANTFFTVTNMSILSLDIDTTTDFDKSFYHSFEFYIFVKRQKEKGEFNSIPQSQSDFINKYNINYAIIYKYAFVPEEIKNRINFSICDEKSGECFVVFK